MQQVQDDVLLHGEQRDAEQGDHQQLHWTHFAQQSPVGDQRAGAAEVSVDQTDFYNRKEEKGEEEERKRKTLLGIFTSLQQNSQANKSFFKNVQFQSKY